MKVVFGSVRTPSSTFAFGSESPLLPPVEPLQTLDVIFIVVILPLQRPPSSRICGYTGHHLLNFEMGVGILRERQGKKSASRIS
ncbi:hypothetical protein Hanom_Chr09g00854721 [Helianthus anomalus]